MRLQITLFFMPLILPSKIATPAWNSAGIYSKKRYFAQLAVSTVFPSRVRLIGNAIRTWSNTLHRPLQNAFSLVRTNYVVRAILAPFHNLWKSNLELCKPGVISISEISSEQFPNNDRCALGIAFLRNPINLSKLNCHFTLSSCKR